jgi:predicted small secreted protein
MSFDTFIAVVLISMFTAGRNTMTGAGKDVSRA